ncbi:hypothetical protein [Allocoleopsis franciscana]|uniref:DUF928 domain-containing protein n=1 Tax=Allocoleopsis franciscana PCC 7113 TaxID=1173027 RepID=K9WE26_9CYAN|nr:hypothetical protein [Allocoleopsis franciscana]AFZ17782.1 protein of unknown function (DUF928) [Allocoleopsis franciscana PCC 7113]
MSKFNWVLSTLLVTTLVSSLLTDSTQTTRAQTHLFGSGENVAQAQTKDNPPPTNPSAPEQGRPGGSRGSLRSSNPWTRILQPLAQDNQPAEDSKKGSSRGPCLLSPIALGNNKEMWSDRPLFVWTGRPIRVELYQVGSDKPLWSHNIQQNQNKVLYDKEALKPGQTYEWRIIGFSQPVTTQFRVMDSQKRDRIKQELQRLDEQLQAQQATPEEIARQRANYFTEQRLWLDVLQEIYSVENPSTALTDALKEMKQAVPLQICT